MDERTYQREYARTDKRKATRKRYNQSPEGKAVINAQCARWRKANPEKYKASMRKHDLKRHYGLTPEGYNEMFKGQGYRCAICLVDEPGSKIGWVVDHCHRTKVVRGLLCSHCNLMLGHAKDNLATLRAATDYLERG